MRSHGINKNKSWHWVNTWSEKIKFIFIDSNQLKF
jgi:hypothetical protein